VNHQERGLVTMNIANYINQCANHYCILPSLLMEDDGLVNLIKSMRQSDASDVVMIELINSYIQDNY
jgi:hypothetical protein